MIFFCLCLPKICFLIQDYYDFHQISSIDSEEIQNIFKKHPLISYLYQYDNASHESQLDEYIVKNKQSYSIDEQKMIETMQSLYSQEIQKLIDKKILSTSLLEHDTKPYQVTFGTLVHEKNDSERYLLNQIYRINSDNDKTIDLTMDKATHKIIGFSVMQKDMLQMSQQDIKDLLWHMIEYLELDDIDDWHFIQNGYESYKAKLRITYQNEVRDGMQFYNINVDTLYSSSSTFFTVNIQ